MSQSTIPVAGPSITQKEIDYVADAVKNAWYGNASIYHERFEKAFAAYIGVKYAMALPSCTSAIHLALLAAGVGGGDEVIVPDITWIASAAPVNYVGATPVFADVDPLSWCITPAAFADAISPRTKAVIPVNLYGNIPEMDEIREIANRNSIFILEDAAESIGSEYKGRKAGSLGDAGVFSFHGSKTMTTGEGGMLVTDSKGIYEQCLYLRDHGRSQCGKMFWNDQVAYKYKMSSMQAALGLAQIERIDELVGMKRQIFAWYHDELCGYAGVTLNYEATHIKNSYWMVTAIFDQELGIPKEDAIQYMARQYIDLRPFFYPLSMLPAYHGLPQAAVAKKSNKVAYSLSPYGVNLPCGLNMTRENVTTVCNALKQLITEKRQSLARGNTR